METRNNDIFEIMERVKKDIVKTNNKENKLLKVLNKPFNIKKSLIKASMFLIILLIFMCFILRVMMLFGIGDNIKWATDTAKEFIRHTTQTALNIVNLIIGFLVGRNSVKKEDEKD